MGAVGMSRLRECDPEEDTGFLLIKKWSKYISVNSI